MAAIPQHLFSSAVAQYARYRTGYPPHEVAALADLLGLDHTQTVIDVGCGTGQLALPLAQHASSVIADDPVPEMLALDRQTAQAANTSNITWLLGDASNLETLVAPGVHAVTFAASFHWSFASSTDCSKPTGRSSLSTTISAMQRIPDWVRAITDLRRSYLGDNHTEPTDPYRNAPDSHRTVFSNSAFSSIQSLTWQWNRELTVDEAVGLQFTYSFSAPALFGDGADGHPQGFVDGS